MTLNRTRALKMSDIAEGSSYVDMTPTEVDPKKDACDAAGYFVQSATGPTGGDTLVLFGRTGSVAQVTDTSGTLTMAQTVSVNAAPGGTQHSALRDAAHFLEGPCEGFASGAYQVWTYVSGSPLLASMTWYASNAMAIPIYSETYTYTGLFPATATCRTFDVNGNQVSQFVETYGTTGGQITSCMRTH